MNIIVTGAAGFIGNNLCERLLKEGHKVVAVDNLSTGNIKRLFKDSDSYLFCYTDVSNPSIASHLDYACDQLFGKEEYPNIIVHLAAQSSLVKSVENPAYDMEVNGIGTLHMATYADKKNARLVFSSTSAIYDDDGELFYESDCPNPSSPYGISKLAAEQYIRSKHISYAILRFGNVYGPRQLPIGENQVVARIMRHILYGDSFYIRGDGTQERDFIYVDDVVSAIIASFNKISGTFNVGTRTRTTINLLVDMVLEIAETRGYEAKKPAHSGPRDPRRRMLLDNKFARRTFEWNPEVKLQDGLRRTFDWWVENTEKKA